MNSLGFTLRVWIGMVLHGTRNAPKRIMARQRSIVDFIAPGVVTILACACLSAGKHFWPLTVLGGVLMAVSIGFTLNRVVRKPGAWMPLLREIRDAKESQIARMYPSHHAWMAYLEKNHRP